MKELKIGCSNSAAPIESRMSELLARYKVIFFDAYGVLIDHGGALPGAQELISHLNDTQKPYFIITNDASRLPEASAERFKQLGLAIAAERIITSGSLLKTYFDEQQLHGKRCVVLGPEDSQSYVRQAGGQVVHPSCKDAEVVVICDEVGFPFVPYIDEVISLLINRLDAGETVHLLVPNPDLIYPKAQGAYGFTAGCIALMIEAALKWRFPERANLEFVRLGKPNAAIFNEAMHRAGLLEEHSGAVIKCPDSSNSDAVMIGDQLHTDILGANRFGIHSALQPSGLTQDWGQTGIQPTYLLSSLTVR